MSASRRLVSGPAPRPARFPSFDAAPPAPAPAGAGGGSPAPAAAAVRAAELEALRERVRAEAAARGGAEGRATAQAEWGGRLAAVAGALEQAGRALIARRIELAAEIERQVPRLLGLLVRKVLQRELAASDTPTRTVLRTLTERLASHDRPVVVRLSPADLEALEACRHATDGAGSVAVRFEPDPTLAPGDWVVDTGDGFLDGRIESQLEEAWSRLEELPA